MNEPAISNILNICLYIYTYALNKRKHLHPRCSPYILTPLVKKDAGNQIMNGFTASKFHLNGVLDALSVNLLDIFIIGGARFFQRTGSGNL